VYRRGDAISLAARTGARILSVTNALRRRKIHEIKAIRRKSKQSEECEIGRRRYFTSTTSDRFSSMSGRMFDD
jgi:hypothetical protein